MEQHDLTQTVKEKMDECPQCHAKLVQASNYRIECKQCGFRMRVSTRMEDFLIWLIIGIGMSTAVSTAVGVIIGMKIMEIGLWNAGKLV